MVPVVSLDKQRKHLRFIRDIVNEQYDFLKAISARTPKVITILNGYEWIMNVLYEI